METNHTEADVRRAKKDLMVKNLMPGLVERGKIKIGMKGEWRKSQGGRDFQLPTKLDHFVITNMVRGEDNNFTRDESLHQALGDKPTSIPVRLLYDAIELNFQTRYSCYRGTTLLCFGNGETGNPMKDAATGARGECGCPCNHQDPKYTGPDKCKINGTLSVMVDQAGTVGGVWKFRTTSYNSVVGILSSLVLIKRISGGALAGIPLDLTIQPKTVANPLDGKMQTIYVVGVEFRGSVKQLQDTGYQIALEYKKHDLRIGHLEGEARRLLAVDAAAFNESPEEIEKEFYSPEAREAELAAAREAGAPELFPPGDEKGGAGDPPPAAQPEKKDPPAVQPEKPPLAPGNKNPRGRPPKPRAAGAPPAQAPAQPEKPPQAPAQAEKEAPPLAGPDFSNVTGDKKDPPQKVIKGNFEQKAQPAASAPSAAQPEKKPAPAAAPGAQAPKEPGQPSLELF